MNEYQDVTVLLKNIQEGIRLYGVKELNEAIINALYKKTDKGEEIEYVLSCICEEYKVTRRNLIKSKRHYNQKARQMAYCILYLDIGLSLRQVAAIFGKYVRSVAVAIENYRKLNPKIKTDKEFIDLYKNFQQKILLHLNKNQE